MPVVPSSDFTDPGERNVALVSGGGRGGCSRVVVGVPRSGVAARLTCAASRDGHWSGRTHACFIANASNCSSSLQARVILDFQQLISRESEVLRTILQDPERPMAALFTAAVESQLKPIMRNCLVFPRRAATGAQWVCDH